MSARVDEAASDASRRPAGTVLELEHLRSPEIGERIAHGVRTAVFACGAVEQHGPHLPLFMDAEHGTHLALAVAHRLGQALVAPTVRIGCSDHHLAFPGSLTLRRETFQAVVRDYCASLVHHGFERIRIIPSHGGNFAPLAQCLPELRAEFPYTDIRAFLDLIGLMRVWKDTVEGASGLGERVGGHADIAETSIMLALHPELVREDLAEPGFTTKLEKEEFDRIIADGFRSVSPNGILGDARGATAPMGHRLIAALADEIVQSFA